jgi:hypothetical protein
MCKTGNVLPYHRLGKTKFERLEINYSVSTSAPVRNTYRSFKKSSSVLACRLTLVDS